MRPPYHVPLWKQAPIIRILLPLVAGIILQWYIQCSLQYILICLVCFTAALLLTSFLPSAQLFQFKKFRGIVFHFALIAFAMLLTWQRDARHHKTWYGHFLNDSSVLVVQINEPLTIKTRSVKAEVIVKAVVNKKETIASSGRLLVYFSKDSLLPDLSYGQQIIINKKLQSITNSGNPGAFNYKRYAAFQLLYHQVFLKREDWVISKDFSINYFQYYLFKTRDHVLSVLKKYIGNSNNELGIAEALLIGYKEELDKDLVQAYSNTGVVHIIAISGLHLGLIYGVLIWLFNSIPYLNKSRHTKAVLLTASLWLFALLTGGSASVLRSAVMFTVIIAGKYYFRQTSVYNPLAASAFLLLCYNPYFLWEVGFQLSYCAVTGIIAFQQFIYRKWFPPNRIAKQVWGMVSITLAAQIGTFPLCIYYFHQFPVYFLFTNLAAVPLSTIILFGEILLIIIAPLETLACYTGKALGFLIEILNTIILFFNGIRYSVIDFIYADIFTTWTMYALVFFAMAWWINRQKRMLKGIIISLAFLITLYVHAFIQLQQQKKIVIYNVSRHKAIDFIDKSSYVFTGDSIMMKEGLQQNFHLKPARIALQAKKQLETMPSLYHQNNYWQFYNKKLLLLDSNTILQKRDTALPVDILLFSHNPPVDIDELLTVVKPAVIVFDGSNSLWKIQKWKSACERLILRCHSVPEQGAFVQDID
jgi:competence protein ComEC